jgi:hypothetical protein
MLGAIGSVAGQAQALCTERGIVLFPMADEEIRAAGVS